MLTLLLVVFPLHAADADADALLALHNDWRAAAGVPLLAWDGELAQEAQARAEALQGGPLTTDPDAVGVLVGMLRVVGENVSAGPAPLGAARRWESESPLAPCAPAVEATGEADEDAGGGCSHHATAVAPYALRLGCGWSEPVLVCRYATP